jgi:sporulation protein YlmC with PRC-barrel domain
MKKTITSDDILGKDAVDTEGDVLGVVMKLHIDKVSKKITGITIDQGFMKPDLFIGMSYIKNFGIDAVFINRVPAAKFRGLKVITPEGKHVGIVRDVRSQRHKVSEIIITKKRVAISKDKYVIPSSDIQEIGENVVLKKGFKLRKEG